MAVVFQHTVSPAADQVENAAARTAESFAVCVAIADVTRRCFNCFRHE
jgi:hypothetical protein